MPGWLSFLAGVPALLSRLLDYLAARQKHGERQAIRAEELAALNIEAEREELRQLKETIHAQDVANADLPDVRAAAERLRNGSF